MSLKGGKRSFSQSFPEETASFSRKRAKIDDNNLNEEATRNIQPCVTNPVTTLEDEKKLLQISLGLSAEEIDGYYNCPWFHHLCSTNPGGEPSSDPAAKRREIVEQLTFYTRFRIQDVSNPVVQTRRHNVSKLKADCCHCSKNVFAVNYVRHLCRCMQVNKRVNSNNDG